MVIVDDATHNTNIINQIKMHLAAIGYFFTYSNKCYII